MFERYTEKARRVIFYARYEASQFGSPYIETEHLLLGLLREAKEVVALFQLNLETIRNQIDSATVIREKVSTSVDLPLSNEGKRVLAYAAEEAEMLGHRHIGTEHLFLGLLREKESFAAELLGEAGVTLERARKEIKGLAETAPSAGARPVPESSLGDRSVTMVEFVEDGNSVAMMVLPKAMIPRQGDEIVLKESNETRRVEKVRFVLGLGAQRIEKVQVILKKMSP